MGSNHQSQHVVIIGPNKYGEVNVSNYETVQYTKH